MNKLKIISWNISSNNFSISADQNWNIIKNHHAILANIIIEEPDIVCLQECNEQFMEFIETKYKKINILAKSKSHCPYTVSYIKNDYIENFKGIFYNDEGIIIIKLNFNDKSLYIINCHLLPGSYTQSLRKIQLIRAINSIKNDIKNSDTSFIILGDLNIRENETNNIETLFNVIDVYNEFDKYSWNSNINIFNKDVKPFKCRFDRVFINNNSNFNIEDFKLFGNHPINNRKHFLSDHFGLSFNLHY